MKRVILSGMRPTGKLHLGNWLGALSKWVELQNSSETQCYFMVADWHALTTDYETPEQIESNIEEMVKDWLSSGIDPAKSVIFRQSWVKAHAELALILSMLTPLSWLERNPTYKDQVQELQNKEIATHGFLGYPVLQAADILLYQATHVPVGEDQLPHLELTREIARRFNHIYKKPVFLEPQSILSLSPRVLGLDGRKMSKSYGNTIELSEDEASLKKKINSMYTDPLKLRAHDPGHPKPCPENVPGCVVFATHEIFSPQDSAGLARREADCKSGALACVPCKRDLLESMNRDFAPRREKRAALNSSAMIWEILQAGSLRAEIVAQKTLLAARCAIGLGHDLTQGESRA